MTFRLAELTMDHYDDMIALMKGTPGLGLSGSDRPEAIALYLRRNPGLSLVAFDSITKEHGEDEKLAGCLLCGHDGRRGYLHHLVVAPSYRRQGLGRLLVSQAMAGLAREGIDKVHLFVQTANSTAQTFWEKIGWQRRDELLIYSKYIEDESVSNTLCQ